MPKNYQSKASFFDILMTWVVMIVVVLSTIAAVAFDMDVKSISMIAIAVVVVLSLYYYKNRERKSIIMIILYVLTIWVIESGLMIYRANGLKPYTLTRLFIMFTGVIMAFTFVNYPINKKLLKILMYGMLGYYFVLIVIMRVPLFLVFTSEISSAVGLLGLLLAVIIPVLYLDYKNDSKVSVLPLLMLAVISLFVESRTGLGACVMLLVFTLFFGAHVIKNKSSRYFAYLALAIMLYISFNLLVADSSSFAGLEKMIAYSDNLRGRDDIWERYFFNFSLNDFFCGRNIEGLNDDVWQNAHNSWIQLHSSLGFAGIIVMLMNVYMLFYFLRRDLYLSLVLFSLIVFSFYNFVFFFTVRDWTIYLFFFEWFRQHSQRTHIEKKKIVKMTFI